MSSGRVVSSLVSALGASFVLGALAGCQPAPDPGVHAEPIVGGTLESAYEAVYLMYRVDGASCTASLISPRVVLTARHCVVRSSGAVAPASAFRLYAGTTPRSFYAEYRVARVEIVPGSTGEIGDGTASDVALLVLSAPAAETPYGLAREEDGNALRGVSSTSVGFGQTPSGSSGAKYRVASRVVRYYSSEGLIEVEPAVCQGDSGGPLLGPDGLVYGVASFITSADGVSEPRCGTAPGFYNEIRRHIAWIDSVMESVGDACIPDPELCDGLDNDCNELVDEGCTALGEPCETSDRCVGGLCADTTAGRICTQDCDPLRLELGCGPGFYCSTSGCEAHCVPGALGDGAVNEGCTLDTDCTTGFCRDPGDGVRRCLDFCHFDANECLGGEVCVPLSGACGGCVDGALVGGARGIGEPCGSGGECRSGLCNTRGGVGECVTPCSEGGGCAEGFVCRDAMCIVDRREPVGGPCIDNGDCQSGICASSGEGSWCTVLCSDDAACPAGMTCDATAGVCAPDLGLDGASCVMGTDCISGLCAGVGGRSVCVSTCGRDDACGVGYSCRRAGAASVCVRPAGGGCSASPAGIGGGARGLWALGIALGAVLIARRRRRA